MKTNKITRLHIDITGACNLRCQHCYASERYQEEINIEKIKTVIQEGLKEGVTKIAFSGGEPFLKSEIFELFELCPQNITILTNGLLINNEIIKKLKYFEEKKNKIFTIKISIDGIESHKKVRGIEFSKVLNKVSHLLEHDFIVEINTTIMPYTTKSEIERLFTIFKEIKIDKWRIDLPFDQGNAKINQLCNDWQNYSDIIIYLANRYIKEVPSFEFDSVSLFSSALLEKGYDLLEFKTESNPCSYQLHSMTIDARGDILICPSIPYKLGNINTQKNLSEYRKNKPWKVYTNIKEYELVGCRHCKYSRICGGGCRANVYNGKTESLYNRDDLSCYLMKRFEKDIIPLLPKDIGEKYIKMIIPPTSSQH